jgi:molecular chaperone HscC
MRFIVEVLVDREVKDSWGGEKKLKYTRLKYTLEISRDKDKRGLDRLYITKEELLPIKKATDKWYKHYAKCDYWIPKIKGGRSVAFINTELDPENSLPTIYLRQDGTRGGKPSRADEVEQTVLSGVANTEFPHAFAMREEMRRWKRLQLNPVQLRKPSPILAKDFIGADGSNLPAALARLKAEDLYVIKDISREINNLLPGITAIDVEEDIRSDQYVLISRSQDGRKFSSRVLSEGTLRVLALLVFKLDIQHKGVLCFEEPENGIHPFRLENLSTLLRELATDFEKEQDIPLRQIIINTHSPVLVGNLFKNPEVDCNILYATLFSKVDPQKKQALRFTKMIPVQSPLGDITEQEQKITLSEVQKAKKKMSIIGIDLGTTNSACAVWRDGAVEMIPNRLGDYLTPSVVYVDQEVIVGKAAHEHAHTQPYSTVSVFKRFMGSEKVFTLNKKKFTPPELSALVLKSLKEDAETYLNESVDEAIISVPAYFNDTQRKATILAGELAGLKVERLINEPTAAAMAYGLHEKPEYTQFMVIDLGGGTFDVSIMEYFNGVLEVHASAGDNFLGGEDFLEILVNKFLTSINLNKNSLNKHDLKKVYSQLEKAKYKLNTADIIRVEPFLDKQKEIVTLKRDDFVQLASPLLERIKHPIEKALRDAKIKPTELDEVLLVGGATRMQFFRSMIAKMFRRIPAANLDPDLVIAMGTAIQAGLKSRDAALDDVVLTDVCPYSLGIATINEHDKTGIQGSLFSPIIERNTVIPVSKVERYYTVQDKQTHIDVEIFQGESRLVKNNISLGNIEVRVPKAKKYEESIDVRFSYDTNGILEVDVTVVSTGQKYYKMLKNSPGNLSEKDIQASKKKLAKLKFHPREQEANIVLIARAERLYEGRLKE